MKSLDCKLCESKIYPYCPNPGEVLWMCENEECLFPFNEEPGTVKEVCSLKPKYSPDSLFKQVRLVQEGKLRATGTSNSKSEKTSLAKVQEDIVGQTQKLSEFLTHYQQADGDEELLSSPKFIDNCDNDDIFDRIFFDDDQENCLNFGDFEDVPMEYEPVFKVEKVCPPLNSNLYSLTDLDLEKSQPSASLSENGNCSDFDMDVEMQEVQSPLPADEQEKVPGFTNGESETEKSSPTLSCTHSLFG